jgi:hypothetical protein
MPQLAQPVSAAERLGLDRFVPAVHRVETQNYNERTLEVLRDMDLAGSKFLTVKYGLIDANQELNKISGIGPGWDSYGADSPSAAAIQLSKNTLAEIAGALILPSAIVRSAGGGVSLYFINGNRTAYIETYNDGTQALVMYDQQGNTDVLEIGSDIARTDVSAKISAYLG